MDNSFTYGSFSGQYVAAIKTVDGDMKYPFGQNPIKNFILDTFLVSLCTGYLHNPLAYVQSCAVGSGSTPPERSQTGIVGDIKNITHASDIFFAYVNSGQSSISMVRNFKFDEETTNQIYREAMIGSFGINNVFNITTSRIVFPSDIYLSSGERFFLQYKLDISLPFLTKDLPLTVSGDGMVFSGALRAWTNETGIFGYLSATECAITRDVYQTSPTIVPTYLLRDYRNNSTSTTTHQRNFFPYVGMGVNYLIPTKTNSTLDRVGFYSTGHVPKTYRTSSEPVIYTITGAPATITRLSYGTGVSGAFTTINYLFPSGSANRTVSGLYINANSVNSQFIQQHGLYFKFTTGCFIPSGKAISLTLQWQLNR